MEAAKIQREILNCMFDCNYKGYPNDIITELTFAGSAIKDIIKLQSDNKNNLGPYFAEAVLLLTDIAEKMGYNMEKEVTERLNVYKEAGRVVFTDLSASKENKNPESDETEPHIHYYGAEFRLFTEEVKQIDVSKMVLAAHYATVNKNPAAYHIGIEKLLVESDKLTLYISSAKTLNKTELSYALRTFALILLDNSKPCYIGDIVDRNTLLDMNAENFYGVDKEIALDGSSGIVSCRKE